MELRRPPILASRKILIAEDNFLEAEDMRQAVISAAGVVLGPAPSIQQSLWLIDQDRPDAAPVSAVVGGLPATLVIKRLDALGIPFMVVTGYAREVLPPELSSAPYVGKPFYREELIEGLVAALDLPAG